MLGEAERMRRAGRAAEAERIAREVVRSSPTGQALNFLALLVRDRGDLTEALALSRRAVAAQPGEALYWVNLSNLLRRSEDFDGAEEALRKATALAPDDAQALTQLGFLLKRRGAFDEALQVLDRALALNPGFFDAHYYRSTTLAALERDEDAIASFRKTLALKPNSPEARHALGGVLLKLRRENEAFEEFGKAIDASPGFLPAHREYNALAWQMGWHDRNLKSYGEARARVGDTPDLLLAEAEQRLRHHEIHNAERLLRRAVERAPERPDVLNALGRSLALRRAYGESIPIFRRALALDPKATINHRELAIALMQNGEAGEARDVLASGLKIAPHDQLMLAFYTLALRELGDGELDRLVDLKRFVGVYELEPPPGFNDVAAFNRALAEELESRHTRNVEPYDQTLHGGTQTPGFLFDRPTRAIEGVRRRIEEAVADYISRLPEDPSHPLFARKSAEFDFSGAWSCRLRSSGFHSNHVHPAGWLSSAYYVSLPDAVEQGGEQGWLKFGESNIALGERDRPERTVKPSIGKLVLFPSYFWHGTVPFASEDMRLTVAFDVVPGKAMTRAAGY